MRKPLAAVVLLAVALAFADSSIVVLALPDLYREFDTTIVEVSFVVTIYNIAIALVAFSCVPLARRVRPALLAGFGFVTFAASSALCGIAGSYETLLAGRALQGVGAAAMLTAAVTVLSHLTGYDERARHLFGVAAVVGAAMGPALGGVLTQLFSWRSIFVVQAPVAAVALLALTHQELRGAAPEESRPRGRRAVWADVGHLFVFGALVGALFLAVILIVIVWRYPPAQGALVVSALPLGTLCFRPLAGRLPPAANAIGGPLVLGGGLAALAFLPDASGRWAFPALFLCGAGLALVGSLLGAASMPPDAPQLRSTALTVGARHAGVVLGLLLIAPVLSADLDSGTREAARAGAATVIDAPVGLRKKVPIAIDLGAAALEAQKGSLPDLDAPFAANGVDDDEEVAALRDDLLGTLDGAITRAFRSSFALAALLGASALVPALVVAGRARARWWPVAICAVGGLLVATGGLLVAESRAGAADYGRYEFTAPCDADPQPFPERGLDAWVQRVTLSALNGAACELGVDRETLVLSLSPDGPFAGEVEWDDETLEHALRAGFTRAIDDGEDRGGLPGWAAATFRFAVRHAPVGTLVDWVTDRVELPI